MLRSSFQNAFMGPWQSLLTRKVLNYIGVPLSIEQEKKKVPKRTMFFHCYCLRLTIQSLLPYLRICFFLQMTGEKKNRKTYFLLSSIFLSEISKRFG